MRNIIFETFVLSHNEIKLQIQRTSMMNMTNASNLPVYKKNNMMPADTLWEVLSIFEDIGAVFLAFCTNRLDSFSKGHSAT